MHTIRIESLKVRCIIGIYAFEREKEQDILVDVALRGDWSSAAEQDDMDKALDYEKVAGELSELLQSGMFQLIEKAAGVLMEKCFSYPGVRGATVRVRKPGAIPAAKEASFEISRGEGA
ncbi:MAG: dihydroneopterin aldolase [Planctomycetota bacterium]